MRGRIPWFLADKHANQAPVIAAAYYVVFGFFEPAMSRHTAGSAHR